MFPNGLDQRKTPLKVTFLNRLQSTFWLLPKGAPVRDCKVWGILGLQPRNEVGGVLVVNKIEFFLKEFTWK